MTLATALLVAGLAIPLAQAILDAFRASPRFLATGPAIDEVTFTMVLSGALLAVAAIGIRLAHRRGVLVGRSPRAMAGMGLVIGLVGLGLCMVLDAMALPPRHIADHYSVLAMLGGSLLILFQASVEEIYFRGWLQPVLTRSWGNFAGITVTAAAFAALHLSGGERAPVTLLNLLLGGLLFGLLAQRSGGIVLPAAAHFAWNWAEAIGLGLSPNPGVGNFGAIVDFDLIGSASWGGSAEGLNASFGMSFVLVALLLPVFAWRGPLSATALPG